MTKSQILRIGVFITSFVQIISPIFSEFKGGKNNEPQFTPAGYTFSIWGIITLLGVFYGIYQTLPNRKNVALHTQIGIKLISLHLLFAFWMFAAGKDWLVITVITFVSMFFLAFFIFQQILQAKNQLTIFDKIFLEAQIGLYLGWSSVAIFANTGAMLKFYGLSDLGTTGIFWQTFLLLAALTNATYILYKMKANYFFVGTIIWAFVGIFFGLRGEIVIGKIDTTFLQIVVISALSAFLIIFYKLKISYNSLEKNSL